MAEYETHWAAPAVCAIPRSPALHDAMRHPAAWAPMADCEAQAQASSGTEVQIAEMAEVRQGVCVIFGSSG